MQVGSSLQSLPGQEFHVHCAARNRIPRKQSRDVQILPVDAWVGIDEELSHTRISLHQNCLTSARWKVNGPYIVSWFSSVLLVSAVLCGAGGSLPCFSFPGSVPLTDADSSLL